VRVNAGLDAAMAEVMKRIHEANRYRAVKLVFIKAEPDVSWGEFMELADRAWLESSELSFLTPKVDDLARHHGCLDPSRNTARPAYSLH
jgi:hypothetical protein